MRKKLLSIFLIICFCLFSTNTFAKSSESTRINAEAASAGSYHSTAISMVFWGVLLVAGMGLAAILIDSSTSTAHSS
ncbi:MAG: hypothetical protein K1060chlam1_00824 [Candidatus Anoxychlamydiales bacterium]|nr:hypothetical protein [Candidatus Anoxychlamydiales bacterium]